MAIGALAQSFLLAERPAITIRLDFDGGSLNFWTKQFSQEIDGRIYTPIAGLTDSLSIRRSLDRPSLDAGISIPGTSEEVKNAALTEQFQGRTAEIDLVNLDADGKTIDASEVLLSGSMQDIPLTADFEEGIQSTVVIESVFADIDRVRDRRLSAADQKRFDANDTFFNFVDTASILEPAFGS